MKKRALLILAAGAVAFIFMSLSSGALQRQPIELIIHAYENFKLTPELQHRFERENHITLKIVNFDSAEQMLDHAISRQGEQADVLYGVDNLNLLRAVRADVFQAYASPQLAAMPEDLKQDKTNQLLPVEVNYITVNYDQQWFSQMGMQPPVGLRGLPQARQLVHRFTMPRPDKSPIGFAFLAATVAAFPEDSAYPWQKFWRDYTPRILHFTETWKEAYGLQFSANNNNPDSHPLVVSFAAAPVAEMLYKHMPQPRIGNLADIAFEQPRFVGIRKDTRLRAIAQKFVDFVMSADFQQTIPMQMLSYPALPDVALPEAFVKYAPQPTHPARLSPEQLDQNRENWTKTWLWVMGMNDP